MATENVQTTHVINTAAGDMWDGFQYGKPGVFSTYFNDFHQFVSGDWTITRVDGGVDGSQVNALADAAGGVLTITTNDADDDSESFQKVGEGFIPTADKLIFYETEIALSDATQTDCLVGLVITDTTPLATTYGIYFRKDDGDTNWDFECNDNTSLSTETGIATATTGYIKLGFRVTGITLVEYYVNGVKAGEFDTNIPAVELTPTMHIQAGEAAAKTLSVRKLYVAQEY